jgi:hypothetical protein
MIKQRLKTDQLAEDVRYVQGVYPDGFDAGMFARLTGRSADAARRILHAATRRGEVQIHRNGRSVRFV